MPRWPAKKKESAEKREARLAQAREYQRTHYYQKRAKQLGIHVPPGTSAQDNYERYMAGAGRSRTKQGQNRLTAAERSRVSKEVWRAKKAADLQAEVPTVQMETTVEVPDGIEPGILAVGNVENGVVHQMPTLPTGMTLMAEFMAQMRKLAIAVRESGAEHGVFTMPDGTTFKVRGDGSVTTS